MRAVCGLPFALLPSLALSLVAGCGEGSMPDVSVPPDPALATALPLPGRHLDRSNPTHAGVLLNLDEEGLPRRHGPDVDPLILEARRFYDTLQAPRVEAQAVDYADPFTGEQSGLRKTAPLSLDQWKQAFEFPARQQGESLAAYRQRAGIVVYYNKNELGLGRELGCSEFDDGLDPGGTLRRGLACFVTNYGPVFGDERRALDMAVEGRKPRNTVCITHRPSLGPGYEVQFYTYGADGQRMEWAQLDSMGPRPHPQVCINCHGGHYDSNRHLARNARFLPLDPNVVVFGSEGPLSRDAQEEPIRRMNAASLATNLTPAQREMLRALYGGQVERQGQVSRTSWAPAGWQGSAADSQLYDKVVKPYCATCHMAIYQGAGDTHAFSYSLFDSPADLQRFPLPAVMCGNFTMPNSQPTMAHFWETRDGPITIGETSFPSAADALLAAFGRDRASCSGLAEISRCDLAPDPDARCGDAQSGLACNRQSGRCVPEMRGEETGAEGFCRMDGSRSCPRTLTCRPAASRQPGLESFDGVCLPE